MIEELGGAKRKVELRGPALPFQGTAWETQQRITSTWNPGNSIEATQHVLGPVEIPSQFEGEWNTTRMITTPSFYYDGAGSSGTQIIRASTLRDVLDAIFYVGARLRVTWVTSELGEGNFKAPERRVQRIGRVSTYKFDHDRADDIRWSAMFEWSSRGNQAQRVVSFRSENMQADIRAVLLALDELAVAVDSKIVSSNRKTKNSADTFTLGDLEAFADGPSKLLRDFARFGNSVTDRMNRLGNLLQKVRGTPAELLGQVVDVATNAVAVSNQFVDAMSRPAPETLSTQNKISNMLQATNYYDGATTQAEAVTDSTMKIAVAFSNKRNANAASSERQGDNAGAGDVKAVHISRSDETFTSISVTYFDTPDHAEAIAVNNGFAAYQIDVERGTVLIIPNLSAIERIEATI